MRWWLGLVFAMIAALTALAVAQVFINRSENEFRERAEDLAIGNAVASADAITRAVRRGDLDRAINVIADRRRLALFVFDEDGALITSDRSHRTEYAAVPQRNVAVRSALESRRYLETFDDGRSIVIALPLRTKDTGALLAYAQRPEIAAELGIVRENIVEAALWAVGVGAVVGFLVAMLIAARLRRITAAAAAIEKGNFERQLKPRFRDELGSLAYSVDRMREHLQRSFEALESERDRLQRLLGRLHEGVLTVDRDLNVEFANPAAARLLGRDSLDEGEPLPDPWPQFSLHRLVSGLFLPDAPMAQARIGPTEEQVIAITGIPAGAGSHTAILVLTDVTEAEQRERAEREFITNAAHELRTPVAAIQSSVEVLQSGAKDVPGERDRFLEAIERQSARLGRLAHSLLVLARAQRQEEAPRLQPIELKPLLDDVAGGLQAEEGVEVVVDCPTGLMALADHDLADQILTNLAANAARYTKEGRIEFSAKAVSGQAVAIEVRDTGPGIPSHQQSRVYERFYRGQSRDSEGFGLGLSIVRQAVRAIGGTIELESTPSKGTLARVTLSAAKVEAA